MVLLSSVSFASALELPDRESEVIASYADLSREDQMIFREQAAACGDLFYKVVSEPPQTQSQMLEKYNLCLIENLDVNKSFIRLLEQNDNLFLLNYNLTQQNSGLITLTEELSGNVTKLANDYKIQSQVSAQNTVLAMFAGFAGSLGIGLFFWQIKKK